MGKEGDRWMRSMLKFDVLQVCRQTKTVSRKLGRGKTEERRTRRLERRCGPKDKRRNAIYWQQSTK